MSLSRAVLVLVELGAAWPAALIGEVDGTSYRVLCEVEGEGPLAFAARAEAFAASAFPRTTTVSEALVACNQRADEIAEAGRRAVAESLLARVAPAGTVSFVTGNATDRFQRRLVDLATELNSHARGTSVRAVLDREEAPRRSGPATSNGVTAPLSGVARVA